MNDETSVGEILGDWLERRNRGEVASPDDLFAAHPELSEELTEALDALRALNQESENSTLLPEGPLGQFGEYRILREIGRGGMGVVYEAEQASMGRKVALKILVPAFTGSRQAVERFQREARAAGSLHHTNIVQAYALGKCGDYWFYTMELLEGGSLSDLVDEFRGERTVERNLQSRFVELAEMFAGVADALHTVHQAGIIHRDLKPSNFLLDGDRKTLKVVDFGMARLDEAPSLTMSGEVLGTPIYMSPEQARARHRDIDHRTDIYSLGATLYEVLTLTPPFKGDSALAVRSQIISRNPPAPRQLNREIPRDLSVICTRAMEKERRDRYQSVGELAKDLWRFAHGGTIRARPIGVAGRIWRSVKRNKLRSSLLAATFLSLTVAGISALEASREVNYRRYVELLALGEEEFGRSLSAVGISEFETHGSRRSTAGDHFSAAIELSPRRAEAYWLRAIAPGRTVEQRFQDIDSALDRGLPQRTAVYLAAYIEKSLVKCICPPEQRGEWHVDIQSLLASNAPISAADSFARARLLCLQGETAEALEMMNGAIADPGGSSVIRFLARRYRGLLRLEARDHVGALEDLLGVHSLGDRSLSTRTGIAQLWKRLGQDEKAEDLFGQILRDMAASADLPAWMNLGEWAERNGEVDWLARISEGGLTFLEQNTPGPTSEWPLHEAVFRGHFLEMLGDSNRALDAYTQAIERCNSTSPSIEITKSCECLEHAYCNRGAIFLRLNDPVRALADLDEAIALDEGDWGFHYNRGRALDRLGRSEEARLAHSKAARYSPDPVRGHVIRADYLCGSDPPAALSEYRAALALNPNHLHALVRTGEILTQQENLGGAIDAFKRAILVDPSHSHSHAWLGYLLAERGDTEGASAAYQEALKYAPEGSDTQEYARDGLDSLLEAKDEFGKRDDR